VFVEKPLCLSLEEGVQIASALRKRPDLKLSSNLILRCSPRFRDLKTRITAGELGEVYAIEAQYNYGRIEKLTDGWRGDIDFYSVFLGGGVHMVDLIRWLTGAEVEEIYATGNRIATAGSGFRHLDYICSLLRLNNGIRAQVSANFGCVHPHFHGLTVYGTQATFINDTPDARLITSRDPEKPAQVITTPYPGCAKGDLLGKFLDEIMGARSMEVTADEVFRTMAVCFAAEESLNTGRPVEVKPIQNQML
jgi:predicted dehydrogenase